MSVLNQPGSGSELDIRDGCHETVREALGRHSPFSPEGVCLADLATQGFHRTNTANASFLQSTLGPSNGVWVSIQYFDYDAELRLNNDAMAAAALADPDELDRLARSAWSYSVLAAVANNPHTQTDTLVFLAARGLGHPTGRYRNAYWVAEVIRALRTRSADDAKAALAVELIPGLGAESGVFPDDRLAQINLLLED